MAFTKNLPIANFNQKWSLVAAFESMKALGWRIRFLSDAGVIGYTNNGAHSWNGELQIKVTKSTLEVQCQSVSGMPGEHSRNEQAVDQYLAKFQQTVNQLHEKKIKELYKTYEKDFIPAYEDTLKPDTRPKFTFIAGFWGIFKPGDTYFVTPLLMIINIFIFLVMVSSGISMFKPEAARMLSWGANSIQYTLGGQWWRLLSSCFLHFGIIHLALNMYALFFVGMLLEPILGRMKFLTAYLLSGILAGLVSLWWNDYGISAGASGAIFGLYGVFLAVLSTNHLERSMRKGLLMNIGLFVVYNLVYSSFQPAIDNAAHLGGLLAGIISGYLYLPALKNPDKQKINAFALTTAIVVVLIASGWAYQAMAASDRLRYVKGINTFYDLEKKAVSLIHQENELTDSEEIEAFYQGIKYWEQGIGKLQELDKLNLSHKLHHQNSLLIKYARLRVRSYQLMAQSQGDEQGDQAQLEGIHNQIKTIIEELSSK